MDSDQDVQAVTGGVEPVSKVGSALRAAREAMGKDLAEVAQLLRIRQPYLSALEDGRHKDLPGVTYAVGFLRTYAEFLDLDGEEMVRRFRQEAAGELDGRAELVFPSPMSEGRIPGGAVLFLGLFLGAVAYGAWYFLSSSDGTVAEMVPALPDRLAGVLNRPATVTADKPAAPAVAEEPVADAARPAEGEPPAAPAGSGEPAPVGEAAPAAAEPAAEAAPAPEPAPVAVPAPVPQPAPAAPEPAAAAPRTEQAPAPASAEPPKVIGSENVNSRVQLRAVGGESWIQVREMDGQMLQSRLLREGDVYLVPNRPGLTLMVGNAGTLEIQVDGKPIAPLGGPGQVRRDVKLDADALLAR